MPWNFTQHSNGEIPHLQNISTPILILGKGPDTTLQQRISVQELLRIETDHIRATSLITRAFTAYHSYDKTIRTFNTDQHV